MDQRAVSDGTQAGAWSVVARLAATDGAEAHPWFRHLVAGAAQQRDPQRDLADAVHALCTLYGHHPGMADEARHHGVLTAAGDWLAEVAQAFAAERSYLTSLSAAAGPLPSTPGHAESQAALGGQRHALDMLARSDRNGCATGAVVALVIDWHKIRRVLDFAAHLYAVARPATRLPTSLATAGIVTAIGGAPSVERAIGFGAQQLLAQHHGLWSLLEARASARRG